MCDRDSHIVQPCNWGKKIILPLYRSKRSGNCETMIKADRFIYNHTTCSHCAFKIKSPTMQPVKMGPQIMNNIFCFSVKDPYTNEGQSPPVCVCLTLSDCFQSDRSFAILYHSQNVIQRQAGDRKRLNFQ